MMVRKKEEGRRKKGMAPLAPTSYPLLLGGVGLGA
jgi:hypothetical protein